MGSVRGGNILLLQATPFYTAEETNAKPLALFASLSAATASAIRSAIVDDGISLSTASLDIAFTSSKGNIKGTVSASSYKTVQLLVVAVVSTHGLIHQCTLFSLTALVLLPLLCVPMSDNVQVNRG